jgi:TRAP transporter TAXI family solute receptor
MRMCSKVNALAVLAAGAFLASSIAAFAQTAPLQAPRRIEPVPNVQNTASPPEREDFVNRLNGNTVSIVSGNPNGTYLSICYDISAVLDTGDDLRVLPIIGKGGGQNVKDILYLKGVDMGITQSNILRYFNESGEVGRNIENRMRYIARLYNEEMHVLVRPEYNTLQDLRGKTVNFSDIGSGTQTTSQLIFKDLRIPVKEVNMGQSDAFEALKKGEIDATILIAGKPTGAFAKLQPNPAYKLIPVAYTPELFEHYLPTKLTNEDYPNMIPKDAPVDSVAVSAVLAVFNWDPKSDRYRRVAKFTEAFFQNFDKFLEKPRHPKWKEVNLAAELPGWTRFGAAQEMLDREKDPNSNTALKSAFESFLTKLSPDAKPATQERRDELFAKFLEWHKSNQRASR